MRDFAIHYLHLIRQIHHNGSNHVNKRTGSEIRLLPEGYSFSINLQDNILPTCGLRRTRPHIAAAEAAWCFMGTTSIEWLEKYTKIWSGFADAGHVNEAYGYRWKIAFGYDQIRMAINRLTVDDTDRRIWISSYDPRSDLLNMGQKTVPCPVGFTLSIYERQLNSTFIIRSSDVFIGLPLDVMRHALVMRAIANSIPDTSLGHMRVTLAHPHLYENQYELAAQMERQEMIVPELKMPLHRIDDIVRDPDEYVTIIKKTAAECTWPKFDPKVNVVK